MKKSFLIAALIAGVMSVGHVAQAQYSGPNGSAKAPNSVVEILRSPVDDQKVTLQGFILRKTAHETYVFSDGTGEITLDLDDDKLPGTPFNEKTRVEIHGEVDRNTIRPTEIDVDWIRIVK